VNEFRSTLLRPIVSVAGAVAVCATVLYFLVMPVIPEAEPPAYSLDAIASALGSGVAAGELDVQLGVPPSPSQNESDRAMSLVLADRLSVEPSTVRVVTAEPQLLMAGRNSRASEQGQVTDEFRDTVRALSEMPDWIVGDFMAAIRINDEHWRIVRPASAIRSDWRAPVSDAHDVCLRVYR
jgi:hypothetical protein